MSVYLSPDRMRGMDVEHMLDYVTKQLAMDGTVIVDTTAWNNIRIIVATSLNNTTFVYDHAYDKGYAAGYEDGVEDK